MHPRGWISTSPDSASHPGQQIVVSSPSRRLHSDGIAVTAGAAVRGAPWSSGDDKTVPMLPFPAVDNLREGISKESARRGARTGAHRFVTCFEEKTMPVRSENLGTSAFGMMRGFCCACWLLRWPFESQDGPWIVKLVPAFGPALGSHETDSGSS
jgi:hypothetical protein